MVEIVGPAGDRADVRLLAARKLALFGCEFGEVGGKRLARKDDGITYASEDEQRENGNQG